jgi:hypothetical protein
MQELRSSLRLFEKPRDVIQTVTDLVRSGKVCLVETRDHNNHVYFVELSGEKFFFMYSTLRDEIYVYVPLKRKQLDQASGTAAE